MFLQAILQPSELEAVQVRKLLRNWELRKFMAQLLITTEHTSVYRCDLDGGACIFYTVVDHCPVGYIHCYLDKNIPIINSTYFLAEYRQKGLGFMTYKAIIDHAGAIVSDLERTQGAIALWCKLSSEPTIDVRDYDRSRLIAVSIKAEIN